MSELTDRFERELDAIVHDPAFKDVEIVTRAARAGRKVTALVVTIDKPGGVDIGTCERIASRINGALDACEDAYSLEVESAGLERPLVRPADYDRFAGKRVRIVTSLTINKAKTHRGILQGLRGETVVVQTDDGELLLPAAIIKSANLEYDPRADLTRDKRERKTNGRTSS